jgi:urease
MFAPLVPETSVLFVSQAAITAGVAGAYGLKKRVAAVQGCRGIGKKDMKFNDYMPAMKVDPERYTVEADGQVCAAEPSEELPLTQQFYVY